MTTITTTDWIIIGVCIGLVVFVVIFMLVWAYVPAFRKRLNFEKPGELQHEALEDELEDERDLSAVKEANAKLQRSMDDMDAEIVKIRQLQDQMHRDLREKPATRERRA